MPGACGLLCTIPEARSVGMHHMLSLLSLLLLLHGHGCAATSHMCIASPKLRVRALLRSGAWRNASSQLLWDIDVGGHLRAQLFRRLLH